MTFESALDLTHTAYRRMGVADINRLPVPTSPVSGKLAQMVGRLRDKSLFGRIRVLSAKQGYDYVGCLGPSAGPDNDLTAFHGRSVIMEAKSSTSHHPSLPIVASDAEHSGGGIRSHQLQALADGYRDWGRIAALVWKNEEQRLVMNPTKILVAWDRYQAGGRKSLPVDEFDEFQCVAYPAYPHVEDWLFPIRIWLGDGAPSPAISQRKARAMVNYRIDEVGRRVTVFPNDDPNSAVTVENVMPDRPLIARIAQESTTPDQFVNRLKRIGVANEN